MMRKLENKNLVAAAIRNAAAENHIKIHELEVMPEHVHLMCSLPNELTDSHALNLLKGRSAHLIFKNKPKFRLRYPRGHFWSPGKCAITVGYNTIDSVQKYIRGQQEHHNVAFL